MGFTLLHPIVPLHDLESVELDLEPANLLEELRDESSGRGLPPAFGSPS